MSDQRQFHPDDVARRTFGTAFRGFEQLEVRAYLSDLAGEMAAAREREQSLREALAVAEAKAGASTMGEAELDAALGLEAGKVLQAARQAAAEIRTRAEEQVERLVREAADDAARIREEANAVLVRCTSEAEAAAESIRADAVRSGTAAAEMAQIRSKEMVAEAQEARERVLQDLNRRRRHAQAQLDQLRAGRERLLAAYRVVRTTLDEATAELTVAEAEADAAAETASLRSEVPFEQLLAGSDERLVIDVASSDEWATAADADDAETASLLSAPIGPPPQPTGGSPAAGQQSGSGSKAGSGAARPKPVGQASEAAEKRGRRRRGEPSAHGPSRGRPKGSEVVLPRDEVEGVRILSSEEAAARREPSPSEIAPGGSRARRATPGAASPTVPHGGSAEGADLDAPDDEVDEPAGRVTSVAPAPDFGTTPETAPGIEGEAAAPGGEVADAAGAASGAAVAADADAEGGAGPGGEGDDEGVDELFARLRARREASVAEAEAVLAEPEHVEEVLADDEVPRVGNAGSEALFEERDELIDPIERSLVKGLKRSLADEQNEVLDALRQLRGVPTLDDLLPPPAEHVARHVDVASGALRRAAEVATGGEEPAVDLADLSGRLAREVADDLRRRLQQAVEGSSDDVEALTESISASYREWKSSRVAPLARHHVLEAYGQARFAHAPEGPLRWLVDGSGGCGPDCDDNALAGDTPKGEPFPTGHLHPPAHPACRCLLVIMTP